MSLILWMQLAVGLAVLIYGVVGPDATRRTLVVLGCLNAGNGGALLLLGQGGSLGVVAIIAYGMFLAWVLWSIPLRLWREMPWLAVTAGGALVGLTALQLLYTSAPRAATQALALATLAFAAVFIVYSLFTTARALGQAVKRSGQQPTDR